jgi:hypothetical protein
MFFFGGMADTVPDLKEDLAHSMSMGALVEVTTESTTKDLGVTGADTMVGCMAIDMTVVMMETTDATKHSDKP